MLYNTKGCPRVYCYGDEASVCTKVQEDAE